MRGSPQPEVSVITTVLNGAQFLEEAIASVFAQETRAPWELLIVDDGSIDDSHAIAAAHARRHPGRVRVLRHPGGRNRGISASRNLGVAAAQAPVLAFLDADDVWLPGKLSLQLPLLQRWPSAAMVYGNTERWFDFATPYSAEHGSAGENHTPPLLPGGAAPGLLRPPTLLEWFLADESLTPCTCSVLVRTADAKRIGGFAEEFTGLYDDQVFYAKLALSRPVYADTRVVARYRRHAGSCCSSVSEADSAAARIAFLSWLERYRGRLRTPPALTAEPVEADYEPGCIPATQAAV